MAPISTKTDIFIALQKLIGRLRMIAEIIFLVVRNQHDIFLKKNNLNMNSAIFHKSLQLLSS